MWASQCATTASAASSSMAVSFTNPMPSASSAVNASAVRNQRRAAAPIFASTKGEMVAGVRPSRTSERRNCAPSIATAISAQATSPTPPPVTWPWATTITGLAQSLMAASMLESPMASAWFSASFLPAAARIQSRSAPAEKLLPLPASTMARTSSAWPNRVKASSSAAMSSALKALCRSGRFSVSRAVPQSSRVSSSIAITSGTCRTEFPAPAAAMMPPGSTPPRRACLPAR